METSIVLKTNTTNMKTRDELLKARIMRRVWFIYVLRRFIPSF
jgi:hypothetical protein